MNTIATKPAAQAADNIPFDHRKLDRLMDEADLDVLIVSSKHNVGYLLGNYRFFFFDYMDAIGLSRYLPLFVYVRGKPERSVYVANKMESYEKELGRFWLPNVITATWGTQDAMRKAIEVVKELDRPPRRIGVEAAFLPGDAYKLLESSLENCVLVDALVPLERLRAKKSRGELAILKTASVGVIDSILAVISSHGAGTTKRELAEALRREETARGLVFEYCLVTTGASHNRSPSDEVWKDGTIASIDSGGNYKGYVGDLCRMAILGEPDAELVDMLAGIEEIQQAARKPIRPGAIGQEIYVAAEAVKSRNPYRQDMVFVAHGMGLITHEAPRLTSTGPIPYPATDAQLPLEEGMVISVETTLLHPVRGFIKLEDTIAVTQTGCEAYGDNGRGWNRGA